MRAGAFALVAFPLVVAACGDGHWGHHRRWGRGGSENEVVFGIRQRIDPKGNREVRASYEYLSIAHQGGSKLEVFRDGDGDGTCYYERFDTRIGTAPVDDGVATWSGGMLPTGGFNVLANQLEPTYLAGAGWSTGQALTFEVAGFALPRIRPESMPAPAAELTVTAITPAAPAEGSAISLSSTDAIGVTWQAVDEAEPTRIMVSLDTDEEDSAGGGLRCFSDAKSGSAVIPAEWVARLFSGVAPGAPLKGTLGVSTHRQLTIPARSDWTVYAVATTLHEERRWTSAR